MAELAGIYCSATGLESIPGVLLMFCFKASCRLIAMPEKRVNVPPACLPCNSSAVPLLLPTTGLPKLLGALSVWRQQCNLQGCNAAWDGRVFILLISLQPQSPGGPEGSGEPSAGLPKHVKKQKNKHFLFSLQNRRYLSIHGTHG